MKQIVPIFLCLLPLALTDCGRVPKATQTRESGQSGLMAETFAGKNACNPDNAERPFIVEWDATDMSSFESLAASDVVMVKYEGCNLRVMDECRNDSIRGSMGAYKPVEWTTGSLEKINIANQGELYAKLPLGAASLGGRVAGGEKFSMEYYVAGTRDATRDAVFRDDIAANPGCEGATHFVYGYNLGAFALGSVKDFSAEAGGSVYGFGVGGKTSSTSNTEKKGGDLTVCKSDSATEIAGCKAPIRLKLRKVREGQDPGKAAMSAEDDSASLNAAGQINAKLEANEAAMSHYSSAMQKSSAGDGKGCLAELDQYDKLNPKSQSTDPASPAANSRSTCLMLAGKCDPGKALLRKALERQGNAAQMTPEIMDSMISGAAQQYCQGKLNPRDELLKAYSGMISSSSAHAKRVDPAKCTELYATLKRLQPTVKPRDEDDHEITSIGMDAIHHMAMACFATAGDCKQAYKLYGEFTWTAQIRASFSDPKVLDAQMRAKFDEDYKKCKGKAP